jgi:hypothetical protein
MTKSWLPQGDISRSFPASLLLLSKNSFKQDSQQHTTTELTTPLKMSALAEPKAANSVTSRPANDILVA